MAFFVVWFFVIFVLPCLSEGWTKSAHASLCNSNVGYYINLLIFGGHLNELNGCHFIALRHILFVLDEWCPRFLAAAFDFKLLEDSPTVAFSIFCIASPCPLVTPMPSKPPTLHNQCSMNFQMPELGLFLKPCCGSWAVAMGIRDKATHLLSDFFSVKKGA